MKHDYIILFDIDYTLFDTDFFKASKSQNHRLFDEVENIISYISRNAQLGILSEGKTELQTEKLKRTNILNFFSNEHYYIVPDKLGALKGILELNKNKKIILVDDRLAILQKAKELLASIKTVWVKRGVYAMQEKNPDNFNADLTISTLKDLPSILNS